MCLAASPGGHLALLWAVRGAFDGCRRVWVTGASSQARALAAEGEEVRVLPAWARDTRGATGAASNLVGALRLARHLRPALVVSSGAGLVVPFALLARALGSRLAFVETMARVSDASLSGRILGPVADTVVVQWPELAGAYRDATVCRPALLEGAGQGDGPADGGTFVSVGTRPEPFDRLLAAVDRAVAAGILPRPVVAQSGVSRYQPANYSLTPWMSPSEVESAIRSSRYVVCHAGSAIVAAAIATGRRPLVLPRLKSRGEHRTEHQRQALERLAGRGLVVAVDEELSAAQVRAADEPPAAHAVDDSLPSVEVVLRAEAAAITGPG